MTTKEFKKRVRYRKTFNGWLHSCMNCKWGNGKVSPPDADWIDSTFIMVCGANSGKKFRVQRCGTCDLCVPRRTDADYPLFPYEIPHVNITVYE